MQQPLIIRTQRDDLLLREVTMDDVAAIFRLVNENGNPEHLSQWGDATAKDYATEKKARETVLEEQRKTDLLRMGIWREGDLVGSLYILDLPAAYNALIGYWLGQQYTGKRYMTTAMRAFVSYAFETGDYFVLKANADRENVKSHRVLERVGFQRLEEVEGNPYVNYKLQMIHWDASAASR